MVKVIFDLSGVKREVEELEKQIESLSDTIKRLNEMGLKISLRIDLNVDKTIKSAVAVSEE